MGYFYRFKHVPSLDELLGGERRKKIGGLDDLFELEEGERPPIYSPISKYQAEKRIDAIRKATERMGHALGAFLATIEYGLMHEIFNSISLSPKQEKSILDGAEEIKKALDHTSHEVKPEFIANRLEAISEKAKSDKNQKLIAQIAVIIDS